MARILKLCFVGVISSARSVLAKAFSWQKITRALGRLGCGGRVYASYSVLSKSVITPPLDVIVILSCLPRKGSTAL